MWVGVVMPARSVIMAMMMAVGVPLVRIRADTFEMVVVALLAQANLLFKPQHLLAVLAELTVHQAAAVDHLINSFDKGLLYQRVIV